MQIKRIIKSRIAFSGLAVFIGFFMLLSTASAVVTPDHMTPDWWDMADAKIVFSPLVYEDISIPLPADGLKGYKYTTHFNETGNTFLSQTYIHINLQNEENPDKTKLFWIGFHFIDFTFGDYSPNETFVDINAKYNDGSQTGTIPFDYFKLDLDISQDGSGWAYFAASLRPQPASEEFTILVDTFLMGDPIFQIDQLEVGTKCVVPVPSALILFAGGLVGLLGLRRRKEK